MFYPAAFEAAYIRPAVRLEIGPLASWVPSGAHSIKAYASQTFPEAFSNPVFEVIEIDAERTFWEKATILHQEAHRPGSITARYSRHYYDLYKLSESPIRSAALANLTLQRSVVEFKERFYYSSWARYDLAIPGSFRLALPIANSPRSKRTTVPCATCSNGSFRHLKRFWPVVEMAERGRGLKDLATKQALEHGIGMGREALQLK